MLLPRSLPLHWLQCAILVPFTALIVEAENNSRLRLNLHNSRSGKLITQLTTHIKPKVLSMTSFSNTVPTVALKVKKRNVRRIQLKINNAVVLRARGRRSALQAAHQQTLIGRWQPSPGVHTFYTSIIQKKRGKRRRKRTILYLTIIPSPTSHTLPPTQTSPIPESTPTSLTVSPPPYYPQATPQEPESLVAPPQETNPSTEASTTTMIPFSTEWHGTNAFQARITGPQQAVLGFDLYQQLEFRNVSIPRDYVTVAIKGLPQGVSYSFPDWQEHCCDGGTRGWSLTNTLLQFHIAAHTSTGLYPLQVEVQSGGVTILIPTQIRVTTLPKNPTVQVVSSAPPIPGLAQWEHNMVHFADQWCDASLLSNWEGSAWYYDGIRVFQQIAAYTNQSYWTNQCAEMVLSHYRAMVLDNGGRLPGWRLFPHGLQSDYERNGTAASRHAVQQMALHSAWSNSGGGVSPELSRETAYLIHTYSIATELGYAEHRHLTRAVNFAIGHLEQIAVTRTEKKVKPFMLALTAEALIRYYEKTKDSRIPSILQQALEFLWLDSATWDPHTQSFLYINEEFDNEDPPLPAADLNLLIAPAYAWLYHVTGDARYQQWADSIFLGGIAYDIDGDTYYDGGACLGCSGKIFNQNYRWSFDFVRWRS